MNNKDNEIRETKIITDAIFNDLNARKAAIFNMFNTDESYGKVVGNVKILNENDVLNSKP